MKSNPLFDLWRDALEDLGSPGLRWQILALLVCFALGWSIARLLRRDLTQRNVGRGMVRFGVESFVRVLWPLLTLALIALVKPMFERMGHVDLLRVAMPLVGSFALIRVALYIMQRVFARRGPPNGLIVACEKLFALLVWIAVSLHITGLLPDVLDFFDQTTIRLGHNKVSVMAILLAVLWVGVTLILALWAAAAAEERLMRLNSMNSSARVLLARMSRAVLILLALLLSLSLVGIDLTVLSVFTGALGVGLGLGLQRLASSYVSGFIILFERGLTIGDVITVDKFSGRIVSINARYTTLRSSDGAETVVPNDMLLSIPVQNFSGTDKTLQISIQIVVAYQADLEYALKLLREAALEVDGVDCSAKQPQAFVSRFTADGIELELTCWLESATIGKPAVTSAVNRAVWRSFQANGVAVPFAKAK
ncbi:MAG TPA: mechanosensitive ion channel domain-containing protein [Oxalicibacterium sp.]|jgi:small-conductance mechanosensitive channel|nr:mechanosensitive ion channel domain-containing protein [Oxalicibacterium sp.]